MRAAGDWLPRLPAHWRKSRLRWLASVYSGGTPSRDNVDYWTNGSIPWMASGVVNQWIISEPSEYITEQAFHESSAAWVPTGAVVMGLAGQGRTKGMVARTAIAAACNQSLCAIVPRGSLEARFLHYWLSVNHENLRHLAGGDKRDGLNHRHVGDVSIPMPPAREQVAIADFLDRETAKIDDLIEKQKQLVIGMSERRSAILDHLVLTLPVAAERLRRFADVTVGIVVTPSAWYADDGVLALRGVNVRPESLSLDDVVYLSEEGDALHEKSRLRRGDVVVVRTGQAGAACAVPPSLFGANAIDLLIVRCRADVMPEYLAAVLNSGPIVEAVKAGSVGAIQGHFNVSSLKDVMVPIPDLPKQGAFLSEWRNKSAQLDALVCRVERAVVVAQERRAALITEAVTGQLDLATGKVT